MVRQAGLVAAVVLLIACVPAAADAGRIVMTARVGWGDSVELHWNRTTLAEARFAEYRLARLPSPYLELTGHENFTVIHEAREINVTAFIDATVEPRNSYFFRIEVVDVDNRSADAFTLHVNTWPIGVYPSAWILSSAITFLGLTFLLGLVVPVLFHETRIANYFKERIFRMLVLAIALVVGRLLAVGLGF